jgi:hypothetical protein
MPHHDKSCSNFGIHTHTLANLHLQYSTSFTPNIVTQRIFMGKQQNGEIDINMVKVKAHEVPQKL